MGRQRNQTKQQSISRNINAETNELKLQENDAGNERNSTKRIKKKPISEIERRKAKLEKNQKGKLEYRGTIKNLRMSKLQYPQENKLINKKETGSSVPNKPTPRKRGLNLEKLNTLEQIKHLDVSKDVKTVFEELEKTPKRRRGNSRDAKINKLLIEASKENTFPKNGKFGYDFEDSRVRMIMKLRLNKENDIDYVLGDYNYRLIKIDSSKEENGAKVLFIPFIKTKTQIYFVIDIPKLNRYRVLKRVKTLFKFRNVTKNDQLVIKKTGFNDKYFPAVYRRLSIFKQNNALVEYLEEEQTNKKLEKVLVENVKNFHQYFSDFKFSINQLQTPIVKSTLEEYFIGRYGNGYLTEVYYQFPNWFQKLANGTKGFGVESPDLIEVYSRMETGKEIVRGREQITTKFEKEFFLKNKKQSIKTKIQMFYRDEAVEQYKKQCLEHIWIDGTGLYVEHDHQLVIVLGRTFDGNKSYWGDGKYVFLCCFITQTHSAEKEWIKLLKMVEEKFDFQGITCDGERSLNNAAISLNKKLYGDIAHVQRAISTRASTKELEIRQYVPYILNYAFLYNEEQRKKIYGEMLEYDLTKNEKKFINAVEETYKHVFSNEVPQNERYKLSSSSVEGHFSGFKRFIKGGKTMERLCIYLSRLSVEVETKKSKAVTKKISMGEIQLMVEEFNQKNLESIKRPIETKVDYDPIDRDLKKDHKKTIGFEELREEAYQTNKKKVRNIEILNEIKEENRKLLKIEKENSIEKGLLTRLVYKFQNIAEEIDDKIEAAQIHEDFESFRDMKELLEEFENMINIKVVPSKKNKLYTELQRLEDLSANKTEKSHMEMSLESIEDQMERENTVSMDHIDKKIHAGFPNDIMDSFENNDSSRENEGQSLLLSNNYAKVPLYETMFNENQDDYSNKNPPEEVFHIDGSRIDLPNGLKTRIYDDENNMDSYLTNQEHGIHDILEKTMENQPSLYNESYDKLGRKK